MYKIYAGMYSFCHEDLFQGLLNSGEIIAVVIVID